MMSLMLMCPRLLLAEEVEIQLTEIIETELLSNPTGDSPMQSGENPTRPNDFRAFIDGHTLSICKQNLSVSSAQVCIVNAATGTVVLNQSFSSHMSMEINTSCVYVLYIQMPHGMLKGKFMVH